MNWNVYYSAQARKDLSDIFDYIAYTLLAHSTATKQVKRIMEMIRSLDTLPLRHRVYEEEPWHSRGLRALPVDNYLVFYLPDERNHTVMVTRIMYGGRDVSKQLDNISE